MSSDLRSSRTADGSDTLFSENFQAHYHSTFGALQESEHVFITHGIDFLFIRDCNKKAIRVLEYGFGTGLNAYLTALYAKVKDVQISYEGIEGYPVNERLLRSLNYSEFKGSEDVFLKIIDAPWEKPSEITPQFFLHKTQVEFSSFQSNRLYDIIYFDAFAPTVQPELWEEDMIAQTYEQLRIGGILVTFCAKGSFKRALRKAGYRVERLPGPPGKREMTRAIK